ncbi:NADPH-dependent F420 reductase [Pseudorhodoferax sp.]|uniref:NADPH-dependent F420 reductase n=1 Tax=Pseudorhodoferax sp. TaxID=1993553 RepID=UPI0039E45444
MKVGIIGAGRMAFALAAPLVRQGHAVMVSNSRGPASVLARAAAANCHAGSAEEAADFGDVVALAIPLHALAAVPVQPLAGKVVLDLINYYPGRDGVRPDLEAGATTTSELVARHLPASRVVKVFNAILADDLACHGAAPLAPGRRALPMAGDDAAAKQVAARLVEDCGFDVVDAGPLAEGWRFERARPVYCVARDRAALADQLAATRRDSMVAEGSWRRGGSAAPR